MDEKKHKCINDVDIISQEEFGPNDTIFVIDGYCFEISSLFRWIFGTIYPLVPFEYFYKETKYNPATNKKIEEEDLKRLNYEYSKYWFKKHLKLYQTFLDEKQLVLTLSTYQQFDIVDEVQKRSPEEKIKQACIQFNVDQKYIDNILLNEKIEDWASIAASFTATGLDKYINCLHLFPVITDIQQLIQIQLNAYYTGNLEIVKKIDKIFYRESLDISLYSESIKKQINLLVVNGRDISLLEYMLNEHQITSGSFALTIASRYMARGDEKKASMYANLTEKLCISMADPEYKFAFDVYQRHNPLGLSVNKLSYCLETAIKSGKYELVDTLYKMGAHWTESITEFMLNKINNLSIPFYILGKENGAMKYRMFFNKALENKNYLACALLLDYEEISDNVKTYWLIKIAQTKEYELIKYYVSKGANPQAAILASMFSENNNLVDFCVTFLGDSFIIDTNVIVALYLLHKRLLPPTQNLFHNDFTTQLIMLGVRRISVPRVIEKIKLLSLDPVTDANEFSYSRDIDILNTIIGLPSN